MDHIRCVKVSKRYLRGTVAQLITRGWRQRAGSTGWFWALQDVDLVVSKPGTRYGIIGNNGSGKTTLLRILVGVTAPTRGEVCVHGRVTPLLEPVTGMQGELTGRENILLVGRILGMRRREIQQKLDAIVAFAEVEQFLDMPLKHYSMGMTMRLGFSIAIHVEAPIIIIDEAWAIGDIGFQTKGVAQIRQLQAKGVTSFVVSHDPEVVRQLTDQAIWLHRGRVVARGDTETILRAYLKGVDAVQPQEPPAA